MIVWRDGDLLPAEQAAPALDDRGYLLGDGLFETLLVRSGRAVRAPAHAARLMSSADRLGLAFSAPPIEAIAEALSRANALQDAALRLTVSRQGGRGLEAGPEASVFAALSPLAVQPDRVSLAQVSIRRAPESVTARHKTLSYADNIEARRQARAAGADMGLVLDTGGRVSGADCANLFWSHGGRFFTPSSACAVLPGTVRAALIGAVAVEETEQDPDALKAADGVFATNALSGVRAVRAIDGRPVAMDEAGLRTLEAALRG